MSGDIGFDARTVAPATGEYEPLPNGTYIVALTASEKKTTDAGFGWSLTFQVISDDYKGKTFRQFVNVQHTTPIAQEIGQKAISALQHVTKLDAQNMAEIHNVAFMAKVKATPPRTDKKTGKEYGPGNEITQYMTAKGEKIGGGVAGSIAPAAKPAAKAGSPPWAKAG